MTNDITQRIFQLRQQSFELNQQIKQLLLEQAEQKRVAKRAKAEQKRAESALIAEQKAAERRARQEISCAIEAARIQQKQARQKHRIAKEFERYTNRRIRLEAAAADLRGGIQFAELSLRTADFSKSAPGYRDELLARIQRLTAELANVEQQTAALVDPRTFNN